MSDLDAYDDEMARIWRLSEEDIERVLAGQSPREESLDGVVGLLQDVRAHFTGPVDPRTRAHDLAVLAREASRLRDGSKEPSVVRRPTSTWRQILDRTRWVALRGAAATVAASLSMIGLAYAGVDLPGQAAEQALEAVTGLELPNQAELPEHADSSVADDVRAVIENSTATGCEFGQEVAAAATRNAEGEIGPDEDPCTKAGAAEAEGSKATGDERSAEGRATAEEKSTAGQTTGDEAASSGLATGGEKSGGTSGDAGENADDADDAGSDQAVDGTGTASSSSGGASDEGTGRKP